MICTLYSVDSTDYPVPEPKITLQTIAQRWLDRMVDDNKNEEYDAKSINDVNEFHEPNVENSAITSSVPVNNELSEDEGVVHSASSNSSDNSLQFQPANSTYTRMEGSVKEPNSDHSNLSYTVNKDNSTNLSTVPDNAPILEKTNTPQLHVPSTKSTASEVRWSFIVRVSCNTVIHSQWFVVK